MELYRKAIAAVIIDNEGRILMCERRDISGAWQFPRGGIEEGENPETALTRELNEELGLNTIEIMQAGLIPTVLSKK